jgi:hypothetical protein
MSSDMSGLNAISQIYPSTLSASRRARRSSRVAVVSVFPTYISGRYSHFGNHQPNRRFSQLSIYTIHFLRSSLSNRFTNCALMEEEPKLPTTPIPGTLQNPLELQETHKEHLYDGFPDYRMGVANTFTYDILQKNMKHGHRPTVTWHSASPATPEVIQSGGLPSSTRARTHNPKCHCRFGWP